MANDVLCVKSLEHECLLRVHITQFLHYRQLFTSSVLKTFLLEVSLFASSYHSWLSHCALFSQGSHRLANISHVYSFRE